MKLNSKSQPFTFMLGMIAAWLVLGIILYPEPAFQASLQGLSIWWNLVFPALFPFLVISEMLIACGAIHALGVWMDPFTRLFFRVSGVGGWAMAMGLVAGYPAGAKITAELRNKRLIGRNEAERLLAVSHICNPVFMIAVVATGFLHRPEIAAFIVGIHYLSALAAGLFVRFYGREEPSCAKPDAVPKRRSSLLRRSLRALRQGRQEDGRGLGELLGDAVFQSIQTLLVIGGYIMIFSVVIRLTSIFHGPPWINFLLPGALEATLGAYYAGQATAASPILIIAAISAILGWSGICMLLQVKSLIHSTDLRFAPFVVARMLHGLLAAILTVVLWNPVNRWIGAVDTIGPFYAPFGAANMPGSEEHSFHLWAYSPWSAAYLFSLLCLMITLGCMIRFWVRK